MDSNYLKSFSFLFLLTYISQTWKGLRPFEFLTTCVLKVENGFKLNSNNDLNDQIHVMVSQSLFNFFGSSLEAKLFFQCQKKNCLICCSLRSFLAIDSLFLSHILLSLESNSENTIRLSKRSNCSKHMCEFH